MCIGNNIVQHFVIFIFFHWRRSGTVSLDMEWEQDTVLLICVVGECTVIHIVLRCGTKKRCLDLKKGHTLSWLGARRCGGQQLDSKTGSRLQLNANRLEVTPLLVH